MEVFHGLRCQLDMAGEGVRMKPWMSVAKKHWIWLYRPLWESVLTVDLSWAKLLQSPKAASLQ